MAIKPKKLITGTLLTDSHVALYTCGVNVVTKVYEIVLCNTSSTVTVGVEINFVDAGGSVGDQNRVFSSGVGGLNLLPLETRTIAMEERLTAGDFISAKASTTNLVSIRAAGDEQA